MIAPKFISQRTFILVCFATLNTCICLRLLHNQWDQFPHRPVTNVIYELMCVCRWSEQSNYAVRLPIMISDCVQHICTFFHISSPHSTRILNFQWFCKWWHMSESMLLIRQFVAGTENEHTWHSYMELLYSILKSVLDNRWMQELFTLERF